MSSRYFFTSNGNFISEDELYHSWSSLKSRNKITNRSKLKFKYIAKVEVGNKYRYFYDKDEYNAYLKGLKTTNTIANIANKTSNLVKITNALKTTSKTARLSISEMVTTGKNVAEKLLTSIETISSTSKNTNNTTAPQSAVSNPLSKLVDKTSLDKKIISTSTNNLLKTLVADIKSINDSPKTFDDLTKKDHEYTTHEDRAAVNPNFGTGTIGETYEGVDPNTGETFTFSGELSPYEINCQSCTLAYDFRQRGYDVEAAPYYPMESFESTIEGISTWYKGVTKDDWYTVETQKIIFPDRDWTPDDLTREELRIANPFTAKRSMLAEVGLVINTMPNGSYGQFCVEWSSGGGHSMVWEKQGGKIVIHDCQTNKSYNLSNMIISSYNFAGNNAIGTGLGDFYDIESVSILRTDDKELTDTALRRVRNAS